MNVRLALLLAVPFVGTACFGSPTPPAPKQQPSKAAKGLARMTGSAAPTKAPVAEKEAPTEPTVINEENLAYVYTPIGKRDPFRSLFEQLSLEEAEQQLTDLQKYELDQLKLVAIVSRIANPYAMVEDPEGKGHSLTRGTLIGKNWGRVSAITAECIYVKEEYRDYTGRKVANKTPKCLPKPEGLKLD